MKITVIGTRGIPHILGGIETHCEELYPRLVKLGHDVCLIRRSCYVPADDDLTEYNGVKLVDLFTVRNVTLETLLHSFLAIIRTRIKGTDVLHIHAVGPALLVPFARMLGIKVVFTHHGPDYNRAKWGPMARFGLKLGERLGTKWANEVIVISGVIKKHLEEKFRRFDTNLIFNGVNIPKLSEKTEYIETLGVKPREYILAMGRFVEEKGFDLLIKAYTALENKDVKLVIAGDADHEMPYVRQLKDLAGKNNVILPGFIKGESLNQLLTHARLFVLPSFHEGLPISLLEAMSYSLPVLVSDIPANKQVKLPEEVYFEAGNENSLLAGLKKLLARDFQPAEYNMRPYDWDKIADQTDMVYQKIAAKRVKSPGKAK